MVAHGAAATAAVAAGAPAQLMSSVPLAAEAKRSTARVIPPILSGPAPSAPLRLPGQHAPPQPLHFAQPAPVVALAAPGTSAAALPSSQLAAAAAAVGAGTTGLAQLQPARGAKRGREAAEEEAASRRGAQVQLQPGGALVAPGLVPGAHTRRRLG